LEKLTKVLNDSVNKSSDNEIEYRIMDKQGNLQWLYSKFVPFRFNDKHETTELLGITYNINERKALEASIRSSENSMRELNLTKDKFFSIISHDLKNPISTFLGLSEVLYSNYEDLSEKEKKTFSKVINDSAKKLYQLIDNLLQWSRIQTGRIECVPESYNIYDIVENIIGLFELQINSKQLIVVNGLEKSQEILLDMNMINTVFRNLISNSIKFSDNNKNIFIVSTKNDTEIIISVQDFGTGMDEQTMANIFKIDKIQSKTGTDGESGTGIGLIICKEFIELHGGKIWVDSKEGFGTTFYFTLPLKKEPLFL
jgi:signal transduction histidine kinase